MKIKIIVGSIVLVVGLTIGSISFVESTVEYADFETARSAARKVQVKGTWVQDKDATFDAAAGEFIFYMVDERGEESKVVLEGAKPNHFELAEAVVVRGRYEQGYFRATEVLTKCPSKYDAGTPAEGMTQ